MERGNGVMPAAATVAVAAAAPASGAVTRGGGARGRPAKVERSGTDDDGVEADCTYDRGGNRAGVGRVTPP